MDKRHPKFFTYLNTLRVTPKSNVDLKEHFETDYDHKSLSKTEGEEMLQLGIEKLSEMQDKIYASGKYSVLIVFQAMDAAGKDGVIKHVMSGLNPQGVLRCQHNMNLRTIIYGAITKHCQQQARLAFLTVRIMKMFW